MNIFVQGTATLNAGNYLNSLEGKPIFNAEFVEAQTQAHLYVLLANEVENATLIPTEVDCINDIVCRALKNFTNENIVSYIVDPIAPNQTLTDGFANEAEAWMNHEDQVETNSKINAIMQQFNPIRDYEKAGLYFTEAVVKLSKIYTIQEILNAVTIIEPHLQVIQDERINTTGCNLG